MKILQVLSTVDINSGVAQVVMNYYKEIHKNITFDFLIYKDTEASYTNLIRECGGNVFVSGEPNIKNFNKYLRFLRDFFKLNSKSYDVVHLHELYINPFIFHYAKKYGIKIRIAHSHTTKYSEHLLGKIRNFILYKFLRYNTTNYCACSYDAAKFAFGKKILNSDKLQIVHNAINYDNFKFNLEKRKQLREQYNIGSRKVICHIGRFSPQKNHEFILKIIKEISYDRRYVFLLIGNGPLMNDIIDLSKRMGIYDNIIFTGTVKNVSDYLSMSDMFILPSIFEGLGNVVIEAQTNGLPCLVSNFVPIDAKILNSCKFLNIIDHKLWVENILQQELDREDNTLQFVNSAGYNIHNEAYKLQEFYTKLREGA